jgi:hypothetical protein
MSMGIKAVLNPLLLPLPSFAPAAWAMPPLLPVLDKLVLVPQLPLCRLPSLFSLL